MFDCVPTVSSLDYPLYRPSCAPNLSPVSGTDIAKILLNSDIISGPSKKHHKHYDAERNEKEQNNTTLI